MNLFRLIIMINNYLIFFLLLFDTQPINAQSQIQSIIKFLFSKTKAHNESFPGQAILRLLSK